MARSLTYEPCIEEAEDGALLGAWEEVQRLLAYADERHRQVGHLLPLVEGLPVNESDDVISRLSSLLGVQRMTPPVIVQPHDLRVILDRLEAAEKDAARYRWLRNPEGWREFAVMSHDQSVTYSGADLDAAIDQAMEASGGE